MAHEREALPFLMSFTFWIPAPLCYQLLSFKEKERWLGSHGEFVYFCFFPSLEQGSFQVLKVLVFCDGSGSIGL